jgi:anti-anti-sigma factor
VAGDAFAGMPETRSREPFGCDVERAGDVVTIRLRGEFDIGAVASFNRSLDAVIAQRPERVILDLRGLTFIDSSGLTAIMQVRAQLHRAELTLVRGPESVQRVFDYTGLAGTLRFVDSADAA